MAVRVRKYSKITEWRAGNEEKNGSNGINDADGVFFGGLQSAGNR